MFMRVCTRRCAQAEGAACGVGQEGNNAVPAGLLVADAPHLLRLLVLLVAVVLAPPPLLSAATRAPCPEAPIGRGVRCCAIST
eukprot:6502540-Pyramimonas_sp.AAC.1